MRSRLHRSIQWPVPSGERKLVLDPGLTNLSSLCPYTWMALRHYLHCDRPLHLYSDLPSPTSAIQSFSRSFILNRSPYIQLERPSVPSLERLAKKKAHVSEEEDEEEMIDRGLSKDSSKEGEGGGKCSSSANQ
jgi:hypothetical protein